MIGSGMKSRWLQHFSMEPPAALVVRGDKFKGLPAGGLTAMVRTFLLFDNQLHLLAKIDVDLGRWAAETRKLQLKCVRTSSSNFPWKQPYSRQQPYANLAGPMLR